MLKDCLSLSITDVFILRSPLPLCCAYMALMLSNEHCVFLIFAILLTLILCLLPPSLVSGAARYVLG